MLFEMHDRIKLVNDSTPKKYIVESKSISDRNITGILNKPQFTMIEWGHPFFNTYQYKGVKSYYGRLRQVQIKRHEEPFHIFAYEISRL